jgi:HEAT repeat protein
MMNRWIVAGSLLLLAIVGAATWMWSSSPAKKLPPVTQQAPQPAVVATDFELQWHEGVAQRYRVSTDSSMQMGGSGVGQSLQVQFNATLDALTLETASHGALVGMQLADVELRINDQTDDGTNRALEKPFRVRFSDGGMPAAFEFPEGISQQNRLTLENLVRMFQVTAGKGESWVAQEHNGTGSYEAVYRRVDADTVHKQKQKFVSGPTQDILTGAVIESNESIRVTPGNDWLQSMSVEETLKASSQGVPALAVTNHATIERDLAARPVLSAAALQFDAVEQKSAALSMIKPTIPNISPEEARKRILAALPELDAVTEGRTTWIHQLRDLLQVDPAMPGVLLEAMRTGDFSDRTRADLYLAFELAGTNSAQSALVSVINDNSWSSRDALRAIVALSGVKQPNDATVSALWNTARSQPYDGDSKDIVSTATFALGSLGKTMNANQDPNYAGLRDNLLSSALSSSNITQRSNYTLALGNTHDSSLTQDVVGLLNDEAEDVRRAAAISLGQLDTDKAADSLMQELVKEPSGEVRSAITESLVSWSKPTPQAMSTIRNVLQNEIDESARYNMARFLGENLTKYPDNRPVLEQLMLTEKSKRIRQSVANLLAADKLNNGRQ